MTAAASFLLAATMLTLPRSTIHRSPVADASQSRPKRRIGDPIFKMIVEMAYEMGKAEEIDEYVRRVINHERMNEYDTLETAIACRGERLKHCWTVTVFKRGNTFPVSHPLIGLKNAHRYGELHKIKIYLQWRQISVQKDIAEWRGGKPKERRALIEALADTGKAFTYHVLTEFYHAPKAVRDDFRGANNIVDRAWRKTWDE